MKFLKILFIIIKEVIKDCIIILIDCFNSTLKIIRKLRKVIQTCFCFCYIRGHITSHFITNIIHVINPKKVHKQFLIFFAVMCAILVFKSFCISFPIRNTLFKTFYVSILCFFKVSKFIFTIKTIKIFLSFFLSGTVALPCPSYSSAINFFLLLRCFFLCGQKVFKFYGTFTFSIILFYLVIFFIISCFNSINCILNFLLININLSDCRRILLFLQFLNRFSSIDFCLM